MSKNNFIYLDNQATTPVSARVIDIMIPYLREIYGNPHSNDHYFGWESRQAVDTARKNVATFIHADSDEIIFTSGATEANNLAILGVLPFLKKAGKTKIIVSAFEHKCVLESAKAAKHHDIDVVMIPPTADGFIDPLSLQYLIDDSVGLVSVMTVNNEIGTVQPIQALCRVTHDAGALFHTDAAQAGIFMDINVLDMDVDMLSLSGHKIYGPKGIGCLYIKRDIQKKISPIIYGGGQEGGLRSGTVPTMLCVGFGEACRIAKEERIKNSDFLKKLCVLFWNKLKEQYPDAILNGSASNRHPGNLSIQFPGLDSHSLLQALQPVVAASTGSACSTGTLEPSYVLRALGLSDEAASASIRFSFGLQNTEKQINRAVEYVVEAVNTVRG
jgi:cysteine desulfurase